MHSEIPKLAHAVGDTASRNAPTWKEFRQMVYRLDVLSNRNVH